MKKKTLIVAAAIAGLPLLLVLVVYAAKFFSTALSSDQTHWGLFGDYVGGTLGAIYGLLAFLAVLYVAHLQHEQAAASQLQSLLASSAETIDKVLRARPSHGMTARHEAARLEGDEITVDWVLTSAVAIRRAGGYEFIRTEEIESIRYELLSLKAELIHFTHCMSEFRRAGGSKAVDDVYRKRFDALVIRLDDVGFLDELTADYFDIEMLRRVDAELRAERRS